MGVAANEKACRSLYPAGFFIKRGRDYNTMLPASRASFRTASMPFLLIVRKAEVDTFK
jgi:hypothetical protein